MIRSLLLNRKNSRNRPAPNLSRNQWRRSGPSVSPCRNSVRVGSAGMVSNIDRRSAASTLTFAVGAVPPRRAFLRSASAAAVRRSSWSSSSGWNSSVHPLTTSGALSSLERDLAIDRLVRSDVDARRGARDAAEQGPRYRAQSPGRAVHRDVALDEVEEAAQRWIL